MLDAQNSYQDTEGDMNKRAIFLTILLLVVLLTLTAFSFSLAGIWFSPNTSSMLYCKGDEFIITQYSDTEILVTCREWLLVR